MANNPPGSAEAFDFKQELAAVLPHLRAFARGLAGRPDFADDLVQEAVLKAWAARDRFTPGTNFKAWTFVILRNCFRTEMRRSKFQGDYDEADAERRLTSRPEQEDALQLDDLQSALRAIGTERREALLLVGAGGFSYEQAAEITGCALGTIKSRVARGRAELAALLERQAADPALAVPRARAPADAEDIRW
jgi:RNA polymerase sigma factor (sigma-70 family)